VELSEFLPEEARKDFDGSDLLLRMETLKRRLAGSEGLHARALRPSKRPLSVPPAAIAGALSYLKGLSALLPDRRIGLALASKITHIVGTIRRRTHG